MLSLRTTFAAGAAALALAPAVAHAGVTSGHHTVASYDFHGSYASSLGTAGPVTPVGSVHAFDASQREGQSVSHLHTGALSGISAPVAGVPAETYTVALNFRLSSVDGRNRVLAFKTPLVDDGFYVVDGQLVFDNGQFDSKAAAPTPIAANTWTQLVITRDASWNVRVYVNGAFENLYTDTPGDTVLSGALGVFTDDGTEKTAGDIARLQLFDGPLSANEASGMERIDLKPPVAEVTSPAAHGGTVYVGKDTFGAGTVFDDGTQHLPTEVRLEKLNGDQLSAPQNAHMRPPSAPFPAGFSMTSRFTFAFVGAPVVDGEQYNLVVEAHDKAGNGTEQARMVIGDTTPPTGLTIATPDGQITDRTPDVTGTLPASAREATFTTARVCKDDACGAGSLVGAVPVWPQGGTYRTTLLADGGRPLPDGSYLVKVTSCDSAENCQVATKPFRVVPLLDDGIVGPVGPVTSKPVTKPLPPKARPRLVLAQIAPLRAAVVKALKKKGARRQRNVRVGYTAPVAGKATVRVLAGKRLVASGSRFYGQPGRGTIVLKARRTLPRKLTIRATFAPRGGDQVTATAKLTLRKG